MVVRQKVAERRQRLDLADWGDLHREQFLKSVDICFEALSAHIYRYADLAREMAAKKAELNGVMNFCRWQKTAS